MKGGVGAFTREVARAMADDGHEVWVFTRSECRGTDEAGIHVTADVNGKWSLKDNEAVSKWATTNQLDVVNIQFQTAAYDLRWPIHALPRKLSKDVPVVVTFHDLRVPYLFPKAGPLREKAVRKLAQDSTGVIATDRADEYVLRESWKLQQVTWIPIGSNVTTEPPSGYDRDLWRRNLGVGPEALLLSYFGFLNKSKGGLVLIEALSELVRRGIPVQLIMIGDRAGSSDPTNYGYAHKVDSLIENLGLTDIVHWSGFVSDEEVSANFYASDMTVLPYLDGVSLRRGTLMAALAHGQAIVTTDAQTNAPELDGVVYCVPADDVTALADGIEKVWSDESLRNQLGEASKKANDVNFTWDAIARSTIRYFEMLIQGD